MPDTIVCWKCGALLAEFSPPFSRAEYRRACRHELHVCRMCRYFDTTKARQCAVLTGGNPLVEPETADTVTLGFTLNPTALPDFTMSLDWYEIEVEDIIGNIPLNEVFNGCADGTHPEFCSMVVRSSFGGLFDKDPPLVDTRWSGPGTPNTWGPYDTLGRTVFFAVTGKF